jgi:hypothetical protein
MHAPELRGTSLPWRVLAALPALAFAAVIAAPPINHDVGAILSFAERWASGAELYRDILDVNPPLVFVLFRAPVWLGAQTGLGSIAALQVMLLGACLLAFVAGARLASPLAAGPVEAALRAPLLALMTVAAGYDAGQREHLALLAALPYLVLAARRAEGLPLGRRAAIAIAVVAALGLALKPHLLLVALLVEAALLRARGRAAFRDPVPWAMAAAWLGYLAAIWLLFPAYPSNVVPIVRELYLDLGVYDAWSVLASPALGAALLALALAAPLGLRGGPLARALWLAAAGAFLAAWVQHKGWTYHAMPVLVLGLGAAALGGARWLDGALEPARGRRAGPAFAAIACGAAALFFARGEAPWRQLQYASEPAGRLAGRLEHRPAGARMLVLGEHIHPVFPALNYAEVEPVLRTMTLWPLQGAYARCEPAEGSPRSVSQMSEAEFFLFRTVAEDVARDPPEIVLVARESGIADCGRPLDLLAYFARHPLFAEAWARYVEVRPTPEYRVFVLEE